MKRSGLLARVKVTADCEGVVSHAGAELLRELAGHTGLIDAWDQALMSTYKAMPIHFPGSVLADLAVAIADGADSISDLRALRDEPGLFGLVASTPTAWRVLDRVSAAHLPRLRAGRAAARAAAWRAGAGPDLSSELCLDLDATIVIAHSDKELAAPTWKHTYGFHPLVCFLDRLEISSGEALAGIVREGRAGSNTTADHVAVLDMALANLPVHARPRPGDPASPSYVARADAAGATHGFAAICRARGVGFSFGFPVTEDVRAGIVATNEDAWSEAIESDDGSEVRDGAWVAEVSEHLDLSSWPEGSRVIVRAERPHPGAQLSLFDLEAGLRHIAFITATRSGIRDERPIALLELRHRRHARIEDRIRQAKAAGLRNLPADRRRRTTPGSSACSPQPTSWRGRSSSASPMTRRSPTARSPRSATASCTSPPGWREAEESCTFVSIAPEHGPSSLHLASPGCARRSPDLSRDIERRQFVSTPQASEINSRSSDQRAPTSVPSTSAPRRAGPREPETSDTVSLTFE